MDQETREKLNQVLAFAGNNESKIKEGTRRCLRDVTDHARYVYLWNLITREATRQIRPASRKPVGFKITPQMRHDAVEHEKQLVLNIPEDDR